MVAAAVIGSAVVGGVVSSKAASKGAKAQTSAANQANETERYIYDQTREDQMPWQQAGRTGLNSLMGLYGFEQKPVPGTGSPAVAAVPATGNAILNFITGNKGTSGKKAVPPDMDWQRSANPSGTANAFMTMDPGYQFRLREGQRNLENSAAERGGLMSGNFLKATTKYGQDYGANEFANIANRYSALAGVGQAANNNLATSGQAFSNAYGQNVTNAGAARASGYAGQSNAVGNAFGNILSGYGAYKNGYFGSPANNPNAAQYFGMDG